MACPGPAVAGDVLPELADVLGHQVGHDAEVVLGGPFVRFRVGHHRGAERRHRLYGAGVEPDLALAVPGGPAQCLAPPEAPDLFQAVVHLLSVPPEALGEEDEVVGVPAARHAEADASAGEVVGHGPLLRHPDRVVEWQHDRPGVEADAPGLPGQGRRQDGGVGEEAAEGVEVPLGHPQRLEAVPVGEPGRFHEQFVAALLRSGPVLRVVTEEVEAEVRAACGCECRGGGGRRLRGEGSRRLRGGGGRCLRGGGGRRLRGRAGFVAGPPGRARVRAEEARLPQLPQRPPYGLGHMLDVAVGVRRGEEEVAPLPYVHAAQHQVVVEEFHVGAVLEAELGPEPAHPDGEFLGLEELVESGGQLGRPVVEPFLQARAVLLEVGEYGAGRRHRHGVLQVGAPEEGGVGGGAAVVPVAPVAAVDPVHDVGAARDGTDGESAAEELAVGGEVRGDTVEILRPAEGRAEPGQHLVEHQHDAVTCRQLSQSADELDRLERGVPALHRLDDDQGDLLRVPFDRVQGRLAAVLADRQLRDGAAGDAPRDGHGLSPSGLAGPGPGRRGRGRSPGR